MTETRQTIQERLLDGIAKLAARGEWASTEALRRESGVPAGSFEYALCKAKRKGLIEVRWTRLPAGNRAWVRAFRIVATGAKTAGFDEASADSAQFGKRKQDKASRTEGMARRKCMACDRMFWSSGPGHRLCATHRGEYDPVTVHRIAG